MFRGIAMDDQAGLVRPLTSAHGEVESPLSAPAATRAALRGVMTLFKLRKVIKVGLKVVFYVFMKKNRIIGLYFCL